MRLSGKTAIVTGAASGIGAAIARRFIREGARVLIVDIDGDGAKKIATELGESAEIAVCDVRDESQIKAAADRAYALWGAVDILVNNAGSELNQTYVDTTIDDWNRVMEVDLRAPWLFCKYVVPGMVERGSGSVVNVASLNSLVGFTNSAAYGAAKGGVKLLTMDLAIELAQSGVRFNAVCPGAIDTPMMARWYEQASDPAAAKAELETINPIGRFGQPDEVAGAVLFFASDDSTLCQGAVLPVDGGFVAR